MIVRILSALSRIEGMRVLSGVDGAIIIICDGTGAWDNTIFTMWVPCQGGSDMIGVGVG